MSSPRFEESPDSPTGWPVDSLISNRNHAPSSQNIENIKLDVDYEKLNTIEINDNSIVLTIDNLVTLSEANGLTSKTRVIKTGKNKGKPAREHWSEAWIRHKEQKEKVYLSLNPLREKVRLPCTVKLTRLGPRELDWDNSIISLKYVRDAVAEIITQDFVPGHADGDKRIKWEYDQIKSKTYAVKIEIGW